MNISELFGSMVFGESQLKARLKPSDYDKLHSCIREGRSLDRDLADVVAAAMKDWAISKGVTHYTHWFQPMTGVTAEKHESFIAPDGNGGAIMEFSGKALVKGESDASSLPSGGLRATFEARGYTAWDPTADAFIKDEILCIPTAFFSYSGYALDKKTPLLRSAQALNKAAMKVLRLFGNESVNNVLATVGAEQEYFLIDKDVLEKRKDLVFTGRTLFGAKPPKGQELDDHYYGALKPRVQFFMKDLDAELWRLGVFAKTEHNEVAPSQHELAPIFEGVNVATDHNQITMEMMKRVATRHKLTCILHEKPFDGLNGSGKHNNWALSTDTGVNLLDPGSSPSENIQFLIFLSAMIKAVDEHADLLRIAVASASNDLRLGGNEAPPATVSIFLGEELEGILMAIAEDRSYSKRAKCQVEVGVKVMPRFTKDTTDRNRTSPFAFTGNKFEFRMPGSSQSIADANITLNTIMAEALTAFYEELKDAKDLNREVQKLVKKTINEHKRVIFNGNSYSEEWRKEAKKRGLPSYQTAVDVLPHFTDEKNITLFEKFGIYVREEMISRREIQLDNYSKIVHIEALTALDMLRRDIFPAEACYIDELITASERARNSGRVAYADKLSSEIDLLTSCFNKADELTKSLEQKVALADSTTGALEKAQVYCEAVRPLMQAIRKYVDTMEEHTAARFWPFPNYGDILFSVN